MSIQKLSYRPEIDGLRAVAVISVILYHARLTIFGRDWFEGGFIGVDIFFVISGYLITRIILIELYAKGSFNFLNFYERRARRILPTLLIVIFISIPFAYQKFLPSDFLEYAESILAALFFGSNFFFYFRTTEYGADSALYKPFLHTWSLGVEEQFYLIFPILTIICFKFLRKYFLIILIGLSVVSLCFSEFMYEKNFNLNFYMPFSRFWELAVGSLLAYRELNYKAAGESFIIKIFPIIGLSMIINSIYFFDTKTPHPSFHTLIPIIGVSLIIGFSSKNELVGRILGSKPFVWVGLVSYSAYLLHYIILAFARINTNEPNIFEKFALIIFTFVISTVSYKLIEKPFRNEIFIERQLFLRVIIISLTIIVFFTTAVIIKNGLPTRFPAGWINFELNKRVLKKDFWFYFDTNKKLLATPQKNKVNVYIFGNSHSGDFLGALFSQIENYKDYRFLKVSKNENLSCMDERDDRFKKNRSALYESDAYKESDIFIIASRFTSQACDNKLKNNPTDADGFLFLVPKLKKDGKKIIILGNTLVLDRIEGMWLADKIYYDALRNKIDFKSKKVFEDYKEIAEKKAYELKNYNNLEINSQLSKFAIKNGLFFFERDKLFCNKAHLKCLVFDNEGYRIRYDYGHLTLKGKIVFGKLLVEAQFEKFLNQVVVNQMLSPNSFTPFNNKSQN